MNIHILLKMEKLPLIQKKASTYGAKWQHSNSPLIPTNMNHINSSCTANQSVGGGGGIIQDFDLELSGPGTSLRSP